MNGILKGEMKIRAIGVSLMVAGIILIGLTTNFFIAIGVLLIVTGNNFEQRANKN